MIRGSTLDSNGLIRCPISYVAVNTINLEDTMKVTCITCKQEVDVILQRYGNGHVAICPVCGKLAYNKQGGK